MLRHFVRDERTAFSRYPLWFQPVSCFGFSANRRILIFSVRERFPDS
jgi:hypothetical protein